MILYMGEIVKSILEKFFNRFVEFIDDFFYYHFPLGVDVVLWAPCFVFFLIIIHLIVFNLK